MDDQQIPPPSEEMIQMWAEQIIDTKALRADTTLRDIGQSMVSYFEEQFDGYKVQSYEEETNSIRFYVSEKDKEEVISEDDFFDSLFQAIPEDPMTEDAKMIAEYIKATFDGILDTLDILKPQEIDEKLKELEMTRMENIPKYREQAFTFWAGKIIDYYKMTKDTHSEFIIKKTQQFFDMLFSKYSIKFVVYKDENRFPMIIDRIDDDSLGWVTEIEKLRRIVFATYYNILNKLGLIADYPKDPNFWFELVLVYEMIGNSEKAKEFGDFGLELNPKDFAYLMEIVIYYGENRRYNEGLQYLKKAGDIFIEKEMYKQALDVWKRVVNFLPNDKKNWLQLALVFDKLNNPTEANQCRQKAAEL